LTPPTAASIRQFLNKMLARLIIENYALIDKLEIDFSEGFSVITGETGAGKSIILGALGLILGQRTDPSVALDPTRKCIVEGHFVISNYNLEEFFTLNELDYEEHSILRREISQSGKSRAFINDTPVNLTVLKELGDHLLNIHSQHSIITLNDVSFQLAVLDDYAGIQNEVMNFREAYLRHLRLKRQLDELITLELKSRNDRDYFQFLFNELEATALKEGEQEEIETRLQVLTHAEEIKTSLYKIIHLLSESDNCILNRLSEILTFSSGISKYHPELVDISSRLRSNHIDLKDINSTLERIAEEVLVDPIEMELLTNRLDLIYKLEAKHHVKADSDLILLKDEFEKKLMEVNSLENKIIENQNELDAQLSELSELASKISGKRKRIMTDFEKNIISLLKDLGMPEAKVKIDHKISDELTPDGIDKVKFLFSSNKGVELDDISRIASGGELSRLMLSVKSLISKKNLLPTIIFDEIDMGVSGEVAGKIGFILKKMAKNMQVIAITHLPQIAGMGEMHYLVYKVVEGEMTKSLMKKLGREERINEIAKMLSSDKVTASASRTASELLKN
jgi:DNA repair protein RecN (Recombination protein N)